MLRKKTSIAEHRTLTGTKYVINREKNSSLGEATINISNNRIHIILKNNGMRREVVLTIGGYDWDKERPNGSNVVYKEKSAFQSSKISLCNNKVVSRQNLKLKAAATVTGEYGTSTSKLTNCLNDEYSAEQMMAALLHSPRVGTFISSVMEEFKKKQPYIEYKFRGYKGYDEFQRLLSAIVEQEAQDYIDNILKIYSVPNSSCDLQKEKLLPR